MCKCQCCKDGNKERQKKMNKSAFYGAILYDLHCHNEILFSMALWEEFSEYIDDIHKITK